MQRPRTTHDAIQIGQELLWMKQRLGHGSFGDYLKSTPIGVPVAERCMRIARYAKEWPDIVNLRLSMAYRMTFVRPEPGSLEQLMTVVQQQWKEKDLERAVCANLQSRGFHYEQQVRCEVGIIDIVTSDAVYEVKLFLSRDTFFHALGQVLMYQQAFDPTRKAIIVGFPYPSTPTTALVDYAQKLGVEVQLWKEADVFPTGSDVLAAQLAAHAAGLAAVASHAALVPASMETVRALEAIERAVREIRGALGE